jgi:DNA-binding winged helix-turn-helix (wHTH) protein
LLKSAATTFSFDRFTLDADDRRLRCDGKPVELNARYFDALELLVRNSGSLVSKDRFLDEVWSGVPVTDEALTQCIRALRKALGDDASRPRFIETAHKHGYRFIAPLDLAGPVPASRGTRPWRETLLLGAAGTIGGGFAGFIGGLIYGFAGASQPLAPGMGAVSILLVILCLSVAVALMGAVGVSFGISIATRVGKRDWRWTTVGGASGGLLIGAVVKLLGIDAFNLLFGHSPAGMTGAFEGTIIGTGVGLSAWFASRSGRLRRSVFTAAFLGAAAGISIVLLGGRLMAGSLDLLARTFPDSRLHLDKIGSLFGERGFGLASQVVTGGLEGALFSACVVGAIVLEQRNLSSVSSRNEPR